MKNFVVLSFLLLGLTSAQADILYTPWMPIFKGIERATGTNTLDASGGPHVVQALRIDLQDPDVRLFTTPPNTNNYVINSRETLSQTPATFLKTNHLKVAINGAHYAGNTSYTAPDGTAEYLHGIAISQGAAVSPSDYYGEADSLMMFSSNKVASFIPNGPPNYYTTNDVYNYALDNDIYQAIPGIYPLVINGANIGYNYTGQGGLHSAQPRSAIGYSEDGRYLILLAIDGRQSDSNGALDYETADWLILFGAYNGMNLDGGGSTAMVMADDLGNSITLNDPSIQYAIGRPGAQRSVGHNVGVVARGFVENLVVNAERTVAVLTWNSPSPATTRVAYGPGLGQSITVETTAQTNHTVLLTGLTPATTNFFQIITTTASGTIYSVTNAFVTLAAAGGIQSQVFAITNSWTYTTNNMDGTGWTAYSYSDAGWIGSGPGLLYVEDNPLVFPRNTGLPSPGGPGIPNTSLPRTYYFRTHFSFPSSGNNVSLTLSNFVDDGAVFYLNGAEVYRLRMPAAPTPIVNSTAPPNGGFPGSQYASTNPNYGDATTNNPAVFTLSGSLITDNLHQGDNVMAVEVHNYSLGSPDIVFGAAMYSTMIATGNVLAVVASDPSLSVPITVTPTDNTGDTNTITPVERLYNSTVTSTVTAPAIAAGQSFVRWRLDGADLSTSLSVNVPMSAAHTLVAVYQVPAPATYTLTANSTPANGINVSVSPADLGGQSSGSTPVTFSYAGQTTVTVTAPLLPTQGTFLKWQLDGVDYATTNSVSLLMDTNHVVTAVYGPPTWNLSVAASGTNSVTVVVSPNDNAGQGSGVTPLQRTYTDGANVALTAPPVNGSYHFLKWQTNGVDFSTNLSVNVLVNTNLSLTAVYALQEWTLAVASAGPSNGVPISVIPADNDGHGSTNTPFTRRYFTGTTVTLVAHATNGAYIFQKWQTNGVDFATNLGVSILMNTNREITVVYALPPAPEHPLLSIQITSGQAILQWTNIGWTLQYATNLAIADWTNFPGPVTNSPFTNDSSEPARYFRLKQ